MSANRGSLGRGLRALVSEQALAEPVRRGVVSRVSVDAIDVNPEQPRAEFDVARLDALKRSIEAHGLLTPLWVRRDGSRFVLIAGERRLRAARLAGLREVPVTVHAKADSPRAQLELALVENLQREDLNPVEAAVGYRRLMERYGMSPAEVAATVGRDRSTIANAVRVLKLPESVLDLIVQGVISAGHGRALLPLVDHDGFGGVVQRLVTAQMSVRALERLVRELLDDRRPTPRPDTTALSERFSARLAAPVQVRPKARGGGTIVIRYSSAEELDRLTTQLTGDE